MGTRKDGKLIYSIGASRSGKSAYVLSQIWDKKRLLVWDVEGEYAAKLKKKLGMIVVSGRRELLAALKKHTGNVRIAYSPPAGKIREEFDFFCRCAFNWIRQAPAAIVCEELAAATNSGKASGYWGVLVSRGLKYEPEIYAVIQRGQEGDKSSMGNATIINICRPNTDKDAIYISEMLGIPVDQIPDKDLHMIQRNKDRSICKYTVCFRGDRPILKAA